MGLLLDTPLSGPCTRQEAFNLELIPGSTHSYQALPNEHLVQMINDVAKQFGLKLTNERLGMDLKGMRFFGVNDVVGKTLFGDRAGLMIGFCNSYNKSMSARVCIGAKVFVCSNMAFHAYTDDLTGVTGIAAHEHRINLYNGLFQRIKAAFETIETFREIQSDFYARLEESKLRKDRAYSIIVRAAQAGVINKTRILRVAQEWDRQGIEPESKAQATELGWHPEFKARNAFSLFNAFTQIMKSKMAVNPVQANIQTLGLTEFFADIYRIKHKAN